MSKLAPSNLLNAAVILSFLTAVSVCAQAQEPAAGAKTAAQQFKNIQVLKDAPANQIGTAMHLIEGELGVTCGFCHIVDQWDRDDKPNKQTAREMMRMMIAINNNTFKGEQVVTCYTCHRGRPTPVSLTALPDPDVVLPPYNPEWDPAKANLPSANEIFSRYIQALGGEAVIRKVTSRVITVERTVPSGLAGTTAAPGTGEIYLKAPNKMLSLSHTDKIATAEGYDGTTEWLQGANGNVTDAPAAEQGRDKRDADFYQSIDLSQNYAKFEVLGTERVRGRDAYWVLAYPQGDSPERLYFDTQTALLIRKITTEPTPLGSLPYQVDYDDYRDTGSGVKIPFLIYATPSTPRSGLDSRTTIHVQKVQDNVPIDDAKFVKPQPPPKRASAQ